MGEVPGIGAEELGDVERDQFVHYVIIARELGDPADWPQFRERLLSALTAAGGVVWIRTDRDPVTERIRVARRREQALRLIDEVRDRHDPVVAWPAFFELLWERWQALCRQS